MRPAHRYGPADLRKQIGGSADSRAVVSKLPSPRLVFISGAEGGESNFETTALESAAPPICFLRSAGPYLCAGRMHHAIPGIHTWGRLCVCGAEWEINILGRECPTAVATPDIAAAAAHCLLF